MKNQYVLIVMLLTLSIVACGNATNEMAVEVEQSIVVEQVAKNEIAEPVKVIEDAETEQSEEENMKIVIVEDYDEDDSEYQVVWETPTTEGNPLAAPPEEVQEEFKSNHKTWDVLTKKYVTTAGKVNYKGMKADLSKIKAYLKHLKIAPPKKDWSKNERLAYWINLYNASTVHLIVSNYPTSSIKKLSGGKPWDKKFIKSGDKTYSLNDIENKIVRPQFKDPRIHAALNCAAVSCPKLLNEAYVGSKLNAQLDKQTFAWVNDKTKNKLSGSKAQLSQIFDWYKDDFKGGVVSFINKYIMTSVALSSKAKITYLEYDWALNE